MAIQKSQQRQLAQIGAATLRYFRDNERKVAWKHEEIESVIRQIFMEDQLEFELQVTNETVKVK